MLAGGSCTLGELVCVLGACCLLGQQVGGVIPGHYRHNIEYRRRSMNRLNYLMAEGKVPGLSELQEATETQTPRTSLHPSTPSFRPSVSRCCKIGEKVARKKKSCHIVYDPYFDDYRPDKQDRSESQDKAVLCTTSEFLHNFQKCCHYRLQFVIQMEGCKRYSLGSTRRKCRKSVREMYP